jgi:hypothetical protein
MPMNESQRSAPPSREEKRKLGFSARTVGVSEKRDMEDPTKLGERLLEFAKRRRYKRLSRAHDKLLEIEREENGF